MSSLQEYLAKKYLSAPSSSDADKQRRKKRPKVKGATVAILDDDVDDWKRAKRPNDSDEDRPVVVDGDFSVDGKGEGGAEESEKNSMWSRVGGAGEDSDVDEIEGATIVKQEGDDDEPTLPRGARNGGTKGVRSTGRRRHDSDSEDDGKGGTGGGGQQRKRRRHDSEDEEDSRRSAEGKLPSRAQPSTSRTRRHDSASPTRSPSPDGGEYKDHMKMKMADGASAGLNSAADVARHAERRRREEDANLRAMDSHQSGKDAATIRRDRSGRKVNPAEERAELLEKQRKEEAEQEKQMQWGTGVAQKRMAEDRVREAIAARDRPFARYANDKELNEGMMAVDRWGDPMAGKIKTKTKVTRPLYKGPPPPPNRFGILPGYRWDGVDRSNGFEAEFFKRKNERVANREEAYKWSAEDM